MSINENDIQNLKPLYDKVLVKKVDGSSKTASGIVLPETSSEGSSIATVIAVGPGSYDEKGSLIPIEISVGDKVLFGQWAGTKVNVSGVKEGTYIIMKASDISGIISGVNQ